MKTIYFIILFLFCLLAIGQSKESLQIEKIVEAIDLDQNYLIKEKGLNEQNGRTTDGGAQLKIWTKGGEMFKIVEEIGLSYGRLSTIIYLKNDQPIKIIEIEENYRLSDGEINFKELREVYKAVFYVYDWELDEGEVIRSGKRIMSEMSCSNYELVEPILEEAKSLLLKKAK